MTEDELLEAARRLGADAVAELDVERVAGAVQRRLADSGRRPRHAAFWLVGLAAAAVLILILRPDRPADSAGPAPAVEAAAPGVLHELDYLTATQLEVVLEALPPAAAAVPVIEEVPLGDLTAADLERLLHSMEE